MSLYFDKIPELMKKQRLKEYIDSFPIKVKEDPDFKPQPRMVQVATSDSITDSGCNFPCVFKQPAPKGMYIMLQSWELSPDYEIIVHSFSPLSSGGYEIQHGKVRDSEKLKIYSQTQNQSLSRDFTILYSPNPLIEEKPFDPLTFQNVEKMILFNNSNCKSSQSDLALDHKLKMRQFGWD